MMGYTKLFNTAKNAYARWQGYGRLVSVTALALLRGEVTIAGLQGKIRQKLQLQQQLKQSMQQDAARYLSTYHVIYIYSLAAGESARYRVHNNVEVLQAAGYNAQAFAEQEIRNLIKYQINAQTVVLARLSLAAAALDPVAMPDPAAINDFLQYAKHKSMQIVFDIDDLAFEPELLPQIQGFTAAQRKIYLQVMQGHQRLLQNCEYATAPTDVLVARMTALGVIAKRIPNTINFQQLELAKTLMPKKIKPNQLRIGYFSGTKSHNVDFQQCEAALLKLMALYPQCCLVIVGYLDLSPAWQVYADRIEKIPFQPYLKMLALLATIDINLAPLELHNLFCDAKSQLKIFEAGLVQVPTVASPTQSYRQAITHGEDGFLAASTEDWFNALQSLVQSTELRETIGERAKLRALMQFGPEALLAAMQTVYRLNYNAIKPTIFIDTALTTTEDISVIARLKEMAELHALQAPLTVTDKRNAWCIVKTNAEIALAKQAGLKSILLRTHHCRDDRDYFLRADFECYRLADAIEFIMTKWQKLMAMANMLIRDVHPGDMILIGGPARVGKSTLATALKYALLDKNYTTKVLRLDNWLKSESERADQGVMNRYRLSDAEAFILQGLQKPGVYRMPFYDRYYRETIPAAVDIEFAADDVLVIEGVVALMSVPLVNRASKRIYLSCPETVRWQNFQQEYYARGLATDDIKTLYQSRLIDENPVVETVKPLADAVISELYLGAADAIN